MCPLCRSPDGTRPFTDSSSDADASEMAWPCSACGGGDAASGALVCVGRACLVDASRDLFAWDASALCYPCAGVTHESAAAAPDFVCMRCASHVL